MNTLADELRLEVLSHVGLYDLWTNVRLVNHQYKHMAEDLVSKQHVRRFTILQHFTFTNTLVDPPEERRGTVTAAFSNVHDLNSDIARFEVNEALPCQLTEPVLDEWMRLCQDGFKKDKYWRVTFGPDGIPMHLRSLEVTDNGTILCNWFELVNVYFRRLTEVWEGLARPNHPGYR